MAYTSRNGKSFVTRVTMFIADWTTTKTMQMFKTAGNTEFNSDVKSSHILSQNSNWDTGNADKDGGGIVHCIGWGDGGAGSPNGLETLLSQSGYTGLGISPFENRFITALGSIQLGGSSPSAFMPGESSDTYLNTQYDHADLVGSYGATHIHGDPDSNSADWFFQGAFFSGDGQSTFDAGNYRAKNAFHSPGNTSSDYGIWIYLDSDDGALKIRWNGERYCAWALALILSPILVK